MEPAEAQGDPLIRYIKPCSGYLRIFAMPYTVITKQGTELSPEEKFAVSHRGAAFRNLLEYLLRATD